MKKGSHVRVRWDNSQNFSYAIVVLAKKDHCWRVKYIDADWDSEVNSKYCFNVDAIEELLYF